MKFVWLLPLCLHVLAAERMLVVAGLGGEAEYEQRFQTLAREAAKLAGGEALTGPQVSRAALKDGIARLGAGLGQEDTCTLVLIGHGTWDGEQYRFNVPGPDVTGEDLRGWLDPLACRQVVVLATSAGGAALKLLSGPRRAVFSATRSGNEKNAVVFPRYWVESLRDPAADSDKNEAVSALEAFRYAAQKTAAFFEMQKRLATEHAAMEDPGGVARATLARFGAAQAALASPQKRVLLAQREKLEIEIEKLKREKAALPPEDYRKRLQALLVALANLQEEIER
ncbi:MAG: hypothetical protein KatS3mg004_3477 [Bryobacteraceae bacterium]|nr:MAG: hypothetical protein KatS3mg004_3477 [Bryobacteraceae bacterium]